MFAKRVKMFGEKKISYYNQYNIYKPESVVYIKIFLLYLAFVFPCQLKIHNFAVV